MGADDNGLYANLNRRAAALARSDWRWRNGNRLCGYARRSLKIIKFARAIAKVAEHAIHDRHMSGAKRVDRFSAPRAHQRRR